MPDEACVEFLRRFLPRLGLRWAGYRRVHRTVCKRLRRRRRELGLPDLAAYGAFVEANPDEWRRLDAMCRIPISRFYRDRAVFDALAGDVMPGLARAAPERGGGVVRCWSAGCASGEEPYTLAMIGAFVLRPAFPALRFAVLGTDADGTMLARAEAGCYERGSLRELPPDWVLVRLAQCPVELSLRQDRHLDELIRELQLLSSDRGNPHSQDVADQIRDLLVSPAHARLTGRRTAERARADGRELVDVDMAMPRELSPMIEQLQAAVARADELCESGHLLALASPPDLRRLRAWMTHEIVAQAERGAAPLPWPEWERRLDDA